MATSAERLELWERAIQAYHCQRPVGDTPNYAGQATAHELVSTHDGYAIWRAESNQAGNSNTADYSFPDGEVGDEDAIWGLLTCIANNSISGTDIVSGHRVRKQREASVDPKLALNKAERALSNVSKQDKQELLDKLMAELNA
jgi:hypothetical protein